MDVQEIDTAELEIDPLNERSSNVGPYKANNSLEESIQEQGIVQPPIARYDDGSYKIIVGQRRTLAAQTVGLESIPVIVADWNDAEALEASITENVDAFRKKVSKNDRSAAIKRLMDLNEWDVNQTADELGISRTTVRDWIERTRTEWEDTTVHINSSEESYEQMDTAVDESSPIQKEGTATTKITKEDTENISDTDLRSIRTFTDTANEREKAVETIIQEGATQSEIREAKKRAERSGGSFDETLEKVSQESSKKTGELRVRTEVTVTGNYAEGLQKAARDAGTSEEKIVREAINNYLASEGYIQQG